MAALYDGDNNRVFQIDNTYKWEDCYEDKVLIPESQRTENGDSPKEELAGVVKSGVNAKGYTLVEYVNDISQENTQVLAEYNADDTLNKAYTYGGNRISVDKSGETSYYLYDGRMSVTGILTEAGALTSSYTYDPYGNLTSGTPDAVNYYGYNAESTNTNTGYQYLRARYYSPETGTFTTEDSDLGTTENPLTRNRYSYTANNPLNYTDPTGHSLWSRFTGAVKSVANKVVNTVKTVARKVVNTVKSAVNWVVNAVTHPKQTINHIQHTVQRTYQRAVSAGSGFVQTISNGYQSVQRTYTSFKSYVAERTSEIKAEIHRELCTTVNRITDKLGKVDWKKVGITAAATVVSLGAVALTGGLATGAVLAALPAMGGLGTAVVTGAVTGAIGGAAFGGTSSLLSGNSAGQVLKDTLLGGASGTVTGGVMGGLGYGAGKAVSGLKNLITGGSKPMQPGHITEMATKKLSSSADDVATPLLEDKRAGQLLLEDKHAGTPLLEDKRAGQLLLEEKGNVGPYSYLEDPDKIVAGKDFTQTQKNRIIEENMKSNGGVVKSDLSGEVLVKPQKSQKGVTPSQNEWQIDHIIPKDKGGTNSYSNAQVLSRKENRVKWNN